MTFNEQIIKGMIEIKTDSPRVRTFVTLERYEQICVQPYPKQEKS